MSYSTRGLTNIVKVALKLRKISKLGSMRHCALIWNSDEFPGCWTMCVQEWCQRSYPWLLRQTKKHESMCACAGARLRMHVLSRPQNNFWMLRPDVKLDPTWSNWVYSLKTLEDRRNSRAAGTVQIEIRWSQLLHSSRLRIYDSLSTLPNISAQHGGLPELREAPKQNCSDALLDALLGLPISTMKLCHI